MSTLFENACVLNVLSDDHPGIIAAIRNARCISPAASARMP